MLNNNRLYVYTAVTAVYDESACTLVTLLQHSQEVFTVWNHNSCLKHQESWVVQEMLHSDILDYILEECTNALFQWKLQCNVTAKPFCLQLWFMGKA